MADERYWFHVIMGTYGSWLYGDPRGFRTRHHREHVEGDYKNPPPAGRYNAQLTRSRRLLKQPPVVLSKDWRPVIGGAVRDKLLAAGAQVLCVSMSGQHCHYLAKMPPGPVPRKWTGMAKRHSHFIADGRGWSGLLWAVRCKVGPVRDRPHQLNTYAYILDHVCEGAWVWDFRRGDLSA